MGLALSLMRRKKKQQEVRQLGDEICKSRIRSDMRRHVRMAPIQWTQGWNPMGIRQKAAVKDHVDAARHAAFVAEALDRNRQPGPAIQRKTLSDLGFQVMRRQIGRVDQMVGADPDRCQQINFALDPLQRRLVRGEGVPAARL